MRRGDIHSTKTISGDETKSGHCNSAFGCKSPTWAIPDNGLSGSLQTLSYKFHAKQSETVSTTWLENENFWKNAKG